jgi:hypothetical protein
LIYPSPKGINHRQPKVERLALKDSTVYVLCLVGSGGSGDDIVTVVGGVDYCVMMLMVEMEVVIAV